MTDPFSTPGGSGKAPYVKGGRYRLFHPETNKPVTYSRVTTFAKTIADTYHLDLWKQRMVAKGLGLRPDLVALAAATELEEKEKLNGVAADAMTAAGSAVGANNGTALHGFTQAVDLGQAPVVPEQFRADVAAYQARMAEAQVKPMPGMIERFVVVPELQLCGQADRVLTGAGRELPFIGDVKSQKDFYSQVEVAVQLAIYSRASHFWDSEADEWKPMPVLDQEFGMVMHVPVGRGLCDLYEVDLAGGWELAELCARVRAARRRSNLMRTITPGATWESLLRTAGSVEALSSIWRAAVQAGEWTVELEAIGMARKQEILS